MKISCVLLAAGGSTRMRGKNKLLLSKDGTSFVRHTLSEIKKFNPSQTIVVTGFDSQRVMDELKDLSPEFTQNALFETGMHSSIKKGLSHLDEDCDGFFICLGDQPFFDASNLTLLALAFEANPEAKIFTPVFEGKRGHPVLISRDLLSEIMQEPDGDYGLSYLLKRYPKSVIEVPVYSRGILTDVDTPEDFAKLKAYDVADPVEDFYGEVKKLRSLDRSFVVATVIEVMGSASAKTGSKAIFDENGRNLLGWVGGGCAERFIGEQSVEAIKENKTRVILADLDDEIFGLGVACGGKMRVFIDPVVPAEMIPLPHSDKFQNEIRSLSSFYGWNVVRDSSKSPETIQDLLLTMANKVQVSRDKSGKSLREVKKVPATFSNDSIQMSENVTIVGRTRITEALARHFTLLNLNVRVVGPDVKPEDYPSGVQCSCLNDSYDSIVFRSREIVIIAGHTSQDPSIVKKALEAKAAYVGMVGSFKRSVEVLTYLGRMEKEVHEPLYVPAGLDIDAKNPDEIALSIVAEVILKAQRNI